MKNNNESVLENFFNYLRSKGISARTLKNYKSDLSHFTGWMIFQLRTLGILAEELQEAIPFFKPELSKKYKQYMLSNKIAHKTVNRRLTTLRHLARFLTKSQILDFNFTQGLSNLPKKFDPSLSYQTMVDEFQNYLKKEKVSPITVKNYLSDIRQFISWLEANNDLVIIDQK